MKKILVITVIFAACIVSLLYFDAPFNVIRPVFHADLINRYATENGLDPLLVTALIKAESNFLHHARSDRGAVGLMQLMPATAGELAADIGYPNARSLNLEDPGVNIRLGTLYLARLKKEFNGNFVLTLAAYNAGSNTVRNWYRLNPLIDTEISDIPYTETRNYVTNVLRTYQWLKRMQGLKNLIRPSRKDAPHPRG